MSFPAVPEDGRQPFVAQLGVLAVLCLVLLMPLSRGPEPVSVSAAPAVPAAPVPSPVLINVSHPLPDTYVPAHLEPAGTVQLEAAAAAAFTDMAEAARAAGVTLATASGYRSFSEQAQLHADYTARFGSAAARELSAPAGASEHQSGLAVDISNPDGACALQECFADTPAGLWVAGDAWRFGFIVRYPRGSTGVTGYAYEPWHLRFVGRDTAVHMHGTGQAVLEQYQPPAS